MYIVRRHLSGTPRQSTFDYCLNLVQKRAYEQYLATLLLPSSIKACGIGQVTHQRFKLILASGWSLEWAQNEKVLKGTQIWLCWRLFGLISAILGPIELKF